MLDQMMFDRLPRLQEWWATRRAEATRRAGQHAMSAPWRSTELPSEPYVLLAAYPYFQNLIGINLHRAGLMTRAVGSKADALTFAREVCPKALVCLISDTGFPDGLSILKAFREMPVCQGIPAVAVVEAGHAHEAS